MRTGPLKQIHGHFLQTRIILLQTYSSIRSRCVQVPFECNELTKKCTQEFFKSNIVYEYLRKKYLWLKKYRNHLPAYIDFPYQTCK